MKKTKVLLNLIFSIVVATVFLSLFSLAYSFSGIHLTNNDKSTDHRWRPYEIKSTMTEGFAWLRMDKNGYNNLLSSEELDAILIGSSHMEALQIEKTDNVSSILNNDYSIGIYNIGMAGHNLYRCVDNYPFSIQKYTPKKYSIIETSSVVLTIPEMNEVIDGNAKRITSYDSGLLYYVQYIPAFRPIYKQLTDWMAQNPAGEGSITQQKLTLPEGYADTLHRFLSIVSNTAKANGIIPIIFYHPSEQINPDGTVTYNTDNLYLDCFASVCVDLDIVFVDMTDSFKNLYATEHQLAYGFINTAVGSGHLNKYGHRAIAEKLAEVIQGLEAE